MVKGKISFAVALATTLVLCSRLAVANGEATQHNATYISTDLDSVIVFEGGKVRFGPFLAISAAAWGSSTTSYISPSDKIQCVSMGPHDNSVEFAIKRPIRVADHYKCGRTTFVVTRCFMNCRSAVVLVETRLGAGRPGTLKSYMYVDDCLGVVAYSQVKDFTAGIPLDAPWLRSGVGVLASNSYPQCRLF